MNRKDCRMVGYKVSSVVFVANDKRREVISNDDDNAFELKN